MDGAGIQPAGGSPAGLGGYVLPKERLIAVLPDATGLRSLGSRRIDPVKKDYVTLEDGRIQGMDSIQHLVQLAITKAEPDLLELDRLDGTFPKAIEATLTRALGPLVASRLVEIVGVDVRMNEEGGLRPGQSVTVLKWRDLTTDEERENEIL